MSDPTGMDLSTVHALYDALAGDRFTFLYSGLFHDEHTARLIALGEEYLDQEERADKSLRGKLVFVMVEAYQNIIRHRAALSPELAQGAGRSMFVLRSGATQHRITAINPVSAADAERLKAALADMNGLDMEQMKQVFLNGLKNEQRSERGGAGLGLIEMARRSGHPLRHGFEALDGANRLFALQVLIGRSASWVGGVEEAFDLHKVVAQEGIAVLCKGHLSTGEQEVVLRIIERDLDDDSQRSDPRMRAFLAATELLGNLQAVGDGPMVLIGRTGDRFTLVVGLPLVHAMAEELTAAVNEINAMDAQGLQRRYRDILLGRGAPAGTLQLGLIELAKRSDRPLRLDQRTWRDLPFLSLEAAL
ncbi:MAG: SiaB family protein kinase [Flavobacteriales bacterium]